MERLSSFMEQQNQEQQHNEEETKYRSLFPNVSAAIQSKKHPLKGDTISTSTLPSCARG
jgi:hypothetical protein